MDSSEHDEMERRHLVVLGQICERFLTQQTFWKAQVQRHTLAETMIVFLDELLELNATFITIAERRLRVPLIARRADEGVPLPKTLD